MNVILPAVSLLLLAYFIWSVIKTVRNAAVTVGGSLYLRIEYPRLFIAALVFYVAMTVMTVAVIIDMLFGIDLRFWL